MRITKRQAALICLLMTIPYGIIYIQLFGNNRYSFQLLVGFMLGVLLQYFDKIEPGETAELAFFWEES
jgi:hypothetical protein